jgi:clan AA aspartic protease (TIGR02281 family)
MPHARINQGFGAAAIALTMMLGASTPGQADMGSFLGGVVGGIIGQSAAPPQPQPTYQYQQPYYQSPTYEQQQSAEARRQYLAHQAELKKKAQQAKEKKDADAAAAAAAAAAPTKVQPGTTEASISGPIDIAMKRKDGNLWVPAQINNVVTIDFVVDSGASDITLPKDVYQTLIRSGTLTKANYIGQVQFGIGDGSQVAGLKFKLASLQVGDQILKDVVASVMPSDSATPLLGLSFLSRFQSWTIDNNAGTLKLVPLPGSNIGAPTQVAAGAPAAPPQAPTIAPLPDPPPSAATGATPAPTPTLKVATNDGPRSGHVGNSALIVTEGTGTPAAPDTPTKPETASALPVFPANTAYSDARASLLALGYGPAPLSEAGKCDADTDTTCFPERLACTKGDGGVQCNFLWKHGDEVIKVKTVAIPPTVATVECQVNCK